MNSGIRIENIIATYHFGKETPLAKLAKTLPNTQYNPEQFLGLVYKLANPIASFLVFSNGKVVCTGCKSEKDLDIAINGFISKIEASLWSLECKEET